MSTPAVIAKLDALYTLRVFPTPTSV